MDNRQKISVSMPSFAAAKITVRPIEVAPSGGTVGIENTFRGKDGKDGKDGESITVEHVEESGESGGINTVTFSDGTSIHIRNGGDGQRGERGENGSDGRDGESVGVRRVEENDRSGGVNTVTFTDGSILHVKNGIDGQRGLPGKDGRDGRNGQDGKSITITNVQTSTASGGTNVITFSDGTKVNILNGFAAEGGGGGVTPEIMAQIRQAQSSADEALGRVGVLETEVGDASILLSLI